MAALPNVPPGANPYDVYRKALEDSVFGTPTSGFAARLGVLFGLCGYAILVSALYMSVNIYECRKQGRQIWFWRLVERPKGRYLLGNQVFIFPTFTIICSVFLIGLFDGAWKVYFAHTAYRSFSLWRAWISIPIFIHGWLASWCSFQASLFSSQKVTGKYMMSPLLANSLYVGLLVLLILIPNLFVAIRSSIRYSNTWDVFDQLLDYLDEMKNADDPSLSAAVFAQLLTYFQELRNSFGDQRAMFIAAITVNCVAIGLVIAVNIMGLSLLFTLKRQINYSIDRYRTTTDMAHLTSRGSLGLRSTVSKGEEPVMLDQISSLPTLPTPGPSPTAATFRRPSMPVSFASDVDEKPLSRTSQPWLPPHVPRRNTTATTTTELRRSAASAAHGMDASRQAKQILAMKKVETDLVIYATVIISVSTTFLALLVWIGSGRARVGPSWFWVEFPLTITGWIYLPTVCTAITCLLVNSVRHQWFDSREHGSSIDKGSARNTQISSGNGAGQVRSGAGAAAALREHRVSVVMSTVTDGDARVLEHPAILNPLALNVVNPFEAANALPPHANGRRPSAASGAGSANGAHRLTRIASVDIDPLDMSRCDKEDELSDDLRHSSSSDLERSQL